MDSLAQNALFLPLVGLAAVSLLLLALLVRNLLKSRQNRYLLQKLEEELEAKEHLLVQARRMEAVGILAGSIVHNLNNLLAVILGHSRMALNRWQNFPALSGMFRKLE